MSLLNTFNHFGKKALFIFIATVGIATSGLAQYTTNIEKAHKAILNLDLDAANQYLSQSDHSCAKVWLSAYAQFIEFLTTTEIKDARKQIHYYDEQIEVLDQFDDSDFKELGIADNLLFKAYTHLSLKEYLWAGTSYLKAQRHFVKLHKNSSGFYVNYRNKLIQLMADAWMTENIPFINRSNSIEEAKKGYLNAINKCLDDEYIPQNFKRELQIVSILLYPYIELKPALIYQKCLSYGQNWGNSGPIENLAFVNACNKSRQYTQATNALQAGLEQSFPEQFNRLNLLLGNAYLNQLNDSAILFLNSYADKQHNKQESMYAMLKQSWYHQIFNQKSQSKNSLISDALTPMDEQALYEFQFSDYWEYNLLASRVLFDGGNYAESLAFLDSAILSYPEFHPYQKITYHYQRARNYHLNKQPEKALHEYQQVIDFDLANVFYFQAYSNYYMGLIYFENSESKKAESSFNACLNTNSPIYKTSIHRKAKLKLEEF